LEAALEEAEKQFVQENKGEMKTRHALGRKVQGEVCIASNRRTVLLFLKVTLAEVRHVYLRTLPQADGVPSTQQRRGRDGRA
jgi:hypothetical protein